MFSNWQTVATAACIALAVLIVVRRLVGLFSTSRSSGCQTGCTACPSRPGDGAAPTNHDFVSVQSLVDSSQAFKESQPVSHPG
jgi:hypothetical protein